jgi:PIN domain nuclease of toxin-antitoxin system
MIKYLLDTNAYIWLDSKSAGLSPLAKQTMADKQSQLFISLISIWEMQIKFQLGKLALRTSLSDILRDQAQQNNVQVLPVREAHIFALDQLAMIHRDPFDRLLVAQAKLEAMIIITADKTIAQYNIKTLW